jgi:hypothetical protein
MVAKAWCPDTASINVFAIIEAELWPEVEAVTCIGEECPVDEIL